MLTLVQIFVIILIAVATFITPRALGNVAVFIVNVDWTPCVFKFSGHIVELLCLSNNLIHVGFVDDLVDQNKVVGGRLIPANLAECNMPHGLHTSTQVDCNR